MTFEILLFRLRELLREKVRNGELTERGMARSIGLSQPHLHNILKGIRSLAPELADQLLALAGLDLQALMRQVNPEAEEVVKTIAIGPSSDPMPDSLPYHRLLHDPAMEPRFRCGDIVYYHRGARERNTFDAASAYLVSYDNFLCVRYLRLGGHRLYLASEQTLDDPIRWDYVSLANRHILEIVRGRIVWICRKLEEIETGASEEARGFNRRAS